MKALIIDDSALSRRMMRRCLEELGHHVTEASDGAEGLERFFLERPDFIMLDLVMPGMTGFEVLDNLRALDPTARVIICSADIQQATRERVTKSGAAAVMNKPVTAEQIAVILENIARPDK